MGSAASKGGGGLQKVNSSTSPTTPPGWVNCDELPSPKKPVSRYDSNEESSSSSSSDDTEPDKSDRSGGQSGEESGSADTSSSSTASESSRSSGNPFHFFQNKMAIGHHQILYITDTTLLPSTYIMTEKSIPNHSNVADDSTTPLQKVRILYTYLKCILKV